MFDRPSAPPSSDRGRASGTYGSGRETAHRRALARHEALCSLMDELRAIGDDLPAFAERLALRWPQVAPVGRWRLLLAWGGRHLLLEAGRGAVHLQWVPALPAWEQAHWQRPRSGRLLPGDLQEAASSGLALPDSLGAKPPLEVLLLPLQRNRKPVGLVSLVPRADPFSAQDTKFCQLLANQLADHVLLLLAAQAEAELARLRDRLTRDALTGAFNLAGVLEQLLTQLALAQRMGLHLSVLLMELVPFDTVRQRHGEAVSDELLRHVMRSLSLASRAGDHVARTQGGSFLFVLYPCDGEQLLAAAQRLVHAVAERPFGLAGEPDGRLGLGVYVGAASSQGCTQPTAEWLIQHAETALHEARRLGPNRVVLAGQGGTIAPAPPDRPLYPPPGQAKPASPVPPQARTGAGATPRPGAMPGQDAGTAAQASTPPGAAVPLGELAANGTIQSAMHLAQQPHAPQPHAQQPHAQQPHSAEVATATATAPAESPMPVEVLDPTLPFSDRLFAETVPGCQIRSD